MSDAIFAKCFNETDADKMINLGFSLFKEENGVYWFINNSSITFSNESLNIEFTSDIDC